ncbi:hypothetical protein [Hungatella sp.]|uniref:hypothetical protein n=1 Tax=Hungatella sp. TaxID=2613924 RepID=UPI003993E4F7
MNRKSVYSLVLAVALTVSFAFPVFADDLATASDSNYFSNQLLNYNPLMLLATVEPSPLYAKVNDSWQQLNQDSSGYIMLPSTATQLMYQFKGQCNIRMLVDSSDLGRFGAMSYQLMPDNTDSYWIYDNFYNYVDDDGMFYLSAYAPYWGNIYFDYSPGSSVQIKFNTYTAPSENLKINGVYDNSDNPFLTKTISLLNRSMYPKSVMYWNNRYYFFSFPSGGVFKKGYEYEVTCFSSFPSGSYFYMEGVDFTRSVDGQYVTFRFKPTRDILSNQLKFCVQKAVGNENVQGAFYYVSSSSSYIPASDTGQQGQTTAANTTIIKNVVTNISNTVSNISNQITTSTTTITNAVNNVANQVTGSINSQTNTLSDKIQGQTNTITDNQNQNTDKVIKNQDENTDKVVKNQDENTDKLTKNQDENTNKVTEKLEDVKTGIISGIIEGLKNLFIPSEDFFKSYFDDLYSWFGERLGFLSFPIDLLAELAEMFLGSSSTDCILTLPGFSISGFKLWEESSFNLTSFLNENFKFVLDAIKLGTSVILVFNFIHLCERKWEEVMMN